MCVFLYQYHHAVFMTEALQYSVKSGNIVIPGLYFFLKSAITIKGLLWVHVNFRVICSTSVKNIMDILIGIILNL